MVIRKHLCDLRIRDVTPFMAAIVLVIGTMSYLTGFLIIDLSAHRREYDPSTSFGSSKTVIQTKSILSAINQQSGSLTTKDNRILFKKTTPGAGDAPLLVTLSDSIGVKTTETKPRATEAQYTRKCSRRGSGRASTDGKWLDWSSSRTLKLYVYSATYDDRSTLQLDSSSSAVIRIIAISSKLIDTNDKNGIQLPVDMYCQLCYENGSAANTQLHGSPKPIGYGWNVNGELLREYIFTCSCPTGQIPSSVTLKRTTDSKEYSCLPVQVQEKRASQQTLAICTGVIGVLPEPYLIIEWLELQKLMGVSLVSVYVMDTENKNAPSYQVLSYYASSSDVNMLVELRTTSFIGGSLDSGQIALHSSPTINDCMYRHMFQYKYMMVIDMNEVIVPLYQANSNLIQLLSFLEQFYKQRLPSNYIFWNSYHFTDDIPDISISPYMTFLRHRRKVALSGYGHDAKSIFDPRSCVNMHNHYCWGVTQALSKNGPSYFEMVHPTVAVKQTYKKCDYGSVKCAEALANSTADDFLLAFRSKLLPAVSDRVQNLIGHNI